MTSRRMVEGRLSGAFVLEFPCRRAVLMARPPCDYSGAPSSFDDSTVTASGFGGGGTARTRSGSKKKTGVFSIVSGACHARLSILYHMGLLCARSQSSSVRASVLRSARRSTQFTSRTSASTARLASSRVFRANGRSCCRRAVSARASRRRTRRCVLVEQRV